MKKIRKILPLLILAAMLTLIPGTLSLAASVPGQVKQVKTQVVNMSTNSSIVLSWKKVSKATQYRVYVVEEVTDDTVDNTADGTAEGAASKTIRTRVATTKDTTCTVKKLKPGTKYSFQVYAYNSAGEGKGSAVVSAKTTNWMKTVHQRYFVATVTSATTATTVSGNRKIRLNKNTKIVTLGRTYTNKTIKATMADGTNIVVSAKKLRYGNVKTTTEYYPQDVKEDFVNKKKYSSKTNYLIWINQYTCNTTIFTGSKGKWKMVRSMPCVIGNGGKTSVGVFKLLKQDTYHNKPRIYFTWNFSKNWGQAFHCRKDSNTRSAVSDGCIRLADSDLYYLESHCAMGTTVVSY